MIRVRNIRVQYQDRQALRGVSATIRPGETIAVMGANGSGKSTFARCLNGLLLPREGGVEVDGLNTSDSAHLREIRRRVGMVFQNPDNQIVSATVEREIAFGLENLGIDFRQMHSRVDYALRQFHLEGLRLKSPHQLSGGEKQRVALAAVLAMQPRYLILDEPTSLLDPRGRREIVRLVRGFRKKSRSMATVLITQFAEETVDADRLIVFDRGRIVMDDPPQHIFARRDELAEIGLMPPMEAVLRHMLARAKEA